jgi:hypothetical protein
MLSDVLVVRLSFSDPLSRQIRFESPARSFSDIAEMRFYG